jgi:ubiquinone/menaquinone biosynthesis C-methylase UbiE
MCSTWPAALEISRSSRHAAVCVVSGVDIAENLIAEAHARASTEGLRIDFKVGDAEALPFADGKFDLVVSKRYPRSEQQFSRND